MIAYTEAVEYRGTEKKEFTGDDGKNVEMQIFRFDDDNGNQNEFWVMDPSKVIGIDSLLRGGLYVLGLNIRRSNKVQLVSIAEK